MEDNVSYDEVEKVFIIKYPFIEDPSILTYNVGQAIKIAERMEKKILKEDICSPKSMQSLTKCLHLELLLNSLNQR